MNSSSASRINSEDTTQHSDLLDRVERLGGSYLDEMREYILTSKKESYGVETKADKSVVTEIDLAVERRLRERITVDFPEHGIIGEEFEPYQAESEFQWIIDPIDGTEEFASGHPFYGSILALHYQERAIWAAIDLPEFGLRYTASRGRGAQCNGQNITPEAASQTKEYEQIRLAITSKTNFKRHIDDSRFFDIISDKFPNFRVFRSCYAHTSVVGRNADVGIEAKVKLWDLAATELLVTESGLSYCELEAVPDQQGALLYTAAFGREDLVEEVANTFKKYHDR